jgi:hypothetical protein
MDSLIELFGNVDDLCSLYGECSDISFVGSISLVVCHNECVPHHKVFASLATRRKASMG